MFHSLVFANLLFSTAKRNEGLFSRFPRRQVKGELVFLPQEDMKEIEAGTVRTMMRCLRDGPRPERFRTCMVNMWGERGQRGIARRTGCVYILTTIFISILCLFTYIIYLFICIYGGFLKWRYPQIIQNWTIFRNTDVY